MDRQHDIGIEEVFLRVLVKDNAKFSTYIRTVTLGNRPPPPQQSHCGGKYKVQKAKRWEDLGVMDMITANIVII